MPPVTLPLTPVSSTELKGQDATQQHMSALQTSFQLPPSAMLPGLGRDAPPPPSSSETRAVQPGPSSPAPPCYPHALQASEKVKSRRRLPTAPPPPKRDSFALPPPPTRSRRIIQMQPKHTRDEPAAAEPSPASASAPASPSGSGSRAAPPARAGGPKPKQQPSTSSAAGRRMARKTAHSVIERRRRSKMNEEFAMLKSLIPACTGEMHKLSILQASIDYLRYLEDCIAQLKAQQRGSESSAPQEFVLGPPAGRDNATRHGGDHDHGGGDADRDDSDVDMSDPENENASSPTTLMSPPSRPQQPHGHPISPALTAEDARRRHSSASTTTTTTMAPGPGLPPPQECCGRVQWGGVGGAPSSPSASSLISSTLTSPALAPQQQQQHPCDPDHEATVALLMLNADRRGTGDRGPGRGLKVRDLLSA